MGDRLIEEYFNTGATTIKNKTPLKELLDYLYKYRNRSFPPDFKERVRGLSNAIQD